MQHKILILTVWLLGTAFVLVACEDATSTPTSGPVTDPQTTADTDTSDSTTISDISDSTSSLETSNATDPVTSSTDGPDGDYNGANNLSGGEIAGIVIGSLAGVGLIGGGVFGVMKYKGKL